MQPAGQAPPYIIRVYVLLQSSVATGDVAIVEESRAADGIGGDGLAVGSSSVPSAMVMVVSERFHEPFSLASGCNRSRDHHQPDTIDGGRDDGRCRRHRRDGHGGVALDVEVLGEVLRRSTVHCQRP